MFTNRFFYLLILAVLVVVIPLTACTSASAVPEATPTSPPLPPATVTSTPGIGSTMVSDQDGMTLVFVPEGEFTMGSDDSYPDEQPAHTVYLDAFWIDQTEMTNKKYQMCVDAGAVNRRIS